MRRDYYLALCYRLLVATTEASCFFPNGDIIDDVPCNSGSGSPCCALGYACLSNGLCELTLAANSNPSGNEASFVRGSCTDRSWADPNCPAHCLSESNGDNLSGGGGIKKCTVGGENRYYCGNNQTEDPGLSEIELCSDKKYYFESDGNPTTATVIGLEAKDWMTGSLAPTGSTLSSTSTPTITALSAPPSGSTSDSPSQESKPDYSVPIGVGVGVPLGILALGILGFLFYRARVKSRNQATRVYEKGNESSHGVSKSNPRSLGVYEAGCHWDETHELPVEQGAQQQHLNGSPQNDSKRQRTNEDV